MDSSAQASVSTADIERLSDKDKADLRQVLQKEEQRNFIQSQSHLFTDICWKKCITGTIKSNVLDSSEGTCLANCVERFLDVNLTTQNHLAAMRQRHGQ
ncbi:Tim10/DDP family zinc finger-domain-containing protein [Apodospora peruviana]|uniref:Mitochondrial import inner membrane translocase subunit n=1 Tax=Apodospora peruviana TaxID=516989 RepID=A0AAE0ICR6_9PEZI|nr:Tim10/DDP family zinc finger-domain-containing protein [Apodospora peruviana]